MGLSQQQLTRTAAVEREDVDRNRCDFYARAQFRREARTRSFLLTRTLPFLVTRTLPFFSNSCPLFDNSYPLFVNRALFF